MKVLFSNLEIFFFFWNLHLSNSETRTVSKSSEILWAIQKMEQRIKMSCENKFILTNVTNKLESSFEWGWSEVVTFSPYLTVSHRNLTENLSVVSSKKFGYCRNIILTLHASIDFRALDDFGRLEDFGRFHKDRFIFIGRNLESLKTTVQANFLTMQRIGMKFGIFWNSMDKMNYLIDPKSFGPMRVQSDAPELFKWDNLRGRSFSTTTSDIPPFLFRNKQTGQIEGAHYLIFNEIAASRNCTFQIDPQKISSGLKLPNGSWTGMMGKLIDGDADIAPMMGINLARYEAVDMTVFLKEVKMKFATAHPKRSPKWQALLDPFTKPLWALLFLIFIAFVFLFYLSLVFSRTKFKDGILYNSLYIPFALSLEQDIKLKVKMGGSLSFIFILWIFFTLITGIAYRSNLIGFLSFPATESIPTTFQALYDRKDYKLIFHYLGGAGYYVFNTSNSKVHKSLTKRFILQPQGDQCAVQAAMEIKTACIAWSVALTNAISTNLTLRNIDIEPVFISQDTAASVYVAVALRKHSIFQEPLNRILSFFVDHGFITKWWKEVATKDKKAGIAALSQQTRSPVYKHMKHVLDEIIKEHDIIKGPLSIGSLLSVFSVLIVGVLISASIFAAELAHFKFNCKTRISVS